MLALLANCVGHFGAMNSAFSRFWARAAKRRQKQENGRGGNAAGSLEGADDSDEFVRVEGRAKTNSSNPHPIEAGQQLCWTESEGSAGTNSGGGGPQLAPVIRIESSESPEGGRRAEELRREADGEKTDRPGGRGQRDSLKMAVGERQRPGTAEKDLSSFSSVELRSHKSSGASGSGGMGPVHGQRPSSSIHGEADLQMCLGRPCARLRLSVQYSEQKKLLILTLHELAQTEELWTLERKEDRAALQVRLALLTDGQQPTKVQKHQSKFLPVEQFQVHFGQTFAFDCAAEQLAGSVVRLRLYRKSREQRRPQCQGVAFLRNYLVDVEAKKAQNHFLQFRRSLVEPKSAKGSMSLFPSLLSLTHSSGHHQPPPPPPPAPHSPPVHCANSQPSPAPASSSSKASPPAALPLPSASSPSSNQHHHNHNTLPMATLQQSSMPATPQSASSSRRGSTVDESGRFCSLPQMGGNQPEVLVSLCYFDVQNRLMVGVDKAAAIGTLGRKEEGHEVFLRISALSPEGAERGKQKSELIRANGTGEIQFNTQAYFTVPRNELAHSSVQVHVFAMQGTWPLRRKQRIGSLTLSQLEQHCSSPDAQTHWREMIQGMGITVDKWHMLELAQAQPQELAAGK